MIETRDVLAGTSEKVGDDRVAVTLESGDIIEITDIGTGIKVCNIGERRMSGLALIPHASNVVVIEVANP